MLRSDSKQRVMYILAMFRGLLKVTPCMAVGAQNDLGGHQTFARKMTWCIAFLCQNWDGFFCPNWGVLKKKKVFIETETVFWQWCAQISRLFARIFDVLNRMGGRPPPCPPSPPASYGLWPRGMYAFGYPTWNVRAVSKVEIRRMHCVWSKTRNALGCCFPIKPWHKQNAIRHWRDLSQ